MRQPIAAPDRPSAMKPATHRTRRRPPGTHPGTRATPAPRATPALPPCGDPPALPETPPPGTTSQQSQRDYPEGIVAQVYAPEPIVGRRYSEPTRHGAEARYADRSERIRAVLDAAAGSTAPLPSDTSVLGDTPVPRNIPAPGGSQIPD